MNIYLRSSGQFPRQIQANYVSVLFVVNSAGLFYKPMLGDFYGIFRSVAAHSAHLMVYLWICFVREPARDTHKASIKRFVPHK